MARLHDQYTAPPHLSSRSVFVWKVMLSSLGLRQTFDAALPDYCERLLCGTLLELARMFMGEMEPRPTALWPHPHWHPEWRLWLALWLEAKGRKKEAFEIVAPSRDPRYGLTTAQPAIEAMLQRL